MVRLIHIKLYRQAFSQLEVTDLLAMVGGNAVPTGWHCSNEYCQCNLHRVEEIYRIDVRLATELTKLDKIGLTCSERCAARFMLSWWGPPPPPPQQGFANYPGMV